MSWCRCQPCTSVYVALFGWAWFQTPVRAACKAFSHKVQQQESEMALMRSQPPLRFAFPHELVYASQGPTTRVAQDASECGDRKRSPAARLPTHRPAFADVPLHKCTCLVRCLTFHIRTERASEHQAALQVARICSWLLMSAAISSAGRDCAVQDQGQHSPGGSWLVAPGRTLAPCCGSQSLAQELTSLRTLANAQTLVRRMFLEVGTNLLCNCNGHDSGQAAAV